MFKSLNKNIFKVLFSFILFFSCIECVFANFFYYKHSDDIYMNCNSQNKCIPLCVYKNSSGEDVGMIGYYYDTGKWEIDFRGDIYRDKLDGKVYDIYYNTGDSLVHSDVIYDPINGNREDWYGKKLYSSLSNEYSCPSRMYIDESSGFSNYNELCFEDDANKCPSLNNVGTVFSSASTLTYNFSSDYNIVVKKAYESLRDKFSDVDEKTNKIKVEFLSVLDSGYTYDSSLSADDNAKNNCSYLTEKADGKYQEYLKTFGSEEYFNKYLNKYLNPSLQQSASLSRSKFTYIYDYKTLYKMKNIRKLGIYEGGNAEDRIGPVIDMFDAAYNINVKDAINFVSSYCNDFTEYKIDMRVDTDGDGVNDSDSMNDIVDSERESFEIRKFADPEIIGLNDPDSVTYDCGFLSDVAGIISDAYFIIEMAGLALLIVLSVFDYVKIFLNDNSDEMKKANTNLFKRLIIAVLLFLLPALVNFSLRLFNIEGINSENPLCVKISNK